MEKLIRILNGVRPDIDFNIKTKLVDEAFIDSFDMVIIISEIESNYGVQLKPTDLTPENFNSAASIHALIEKYQTQ